MKQTQETKEEKTELPEVNKPEYTHIPETELEFKSIIAVKDKETGFITQIRMETVDNETFTHKPVLRVETKGKGIIPSITIDRRSPKDSELNPIFENIYKEIQKEKTCAVKAGYTRMTTLNNKSEKTVYCFFTEDDINNMEII